jgi:hypothetical protein
MRTAANAIAAAPGVAAAIVAGIPVVGPIIAAVLAAIAAVIISIGTLLAKAKEDEAAAKERDRPSSAGAKPAAPAVAAVSWRIAYSRLQ